VLLENQNATICVPCDWARTLEPIIAPKHEKRVPLFDDQVISTHGRGMTDRETRGHLEEICDVEVSPDLISWVTNAIWTRFASGPHRRKKLHEKRLRGVALGVSLEGKKEVLGLWIAETEGAKLWMGVLTELKNRGARDILIACMDGLSGFPDAARWCTRRPARSGA